MNSLEIPKTLVSKKAKVGRQGKPANSAEGRKHPELKPAAFDERGRSIAWITRTIHRLYNVHAQTVLDREGVTIAHWYYLRVLSEHGTLNQLELSKRVGIASTTAVTALDNLEKRGLLKRTRDPSDRRKYFVGLTAEGARLITALMPDLEKMFEASLEGISPEEMRVFWKVADQLAKNLSHTGDRDADLMVD